MRKTIISSISVICLLGMISCADKFDFSTDNLSTNIEQKTGLAFPLVDASITIKKVFPDNDELNRVIIFEEDGFIRIQYDFEVGGFPAEDFFNGDYSGNSLPYYDYSADPQIITLNLNNLIKEGEFYLADPKIEFRIKNYWDIPVRFRFQDFYYYEEENSPALPITGPIFNTWFLVERPVAPAEYGITTITLDTNNSNIDQVLSALPHHLTAGAYMETIPGGPYDIDPSTTDSININIDVPLDLRFSDLVFRDTMDVSLGEDLGDDTSNVESLEISMLMDNGFPVGIDAQVYFTDANYLILDSISAQKITIAPASIANGKVTTSTKSSIKIVIENGRKTNLLKAAHLLLNIKFETKDAELGNSVKIYDNYVFGLKMGALIRLKFKT